jgi:cytochrome c-type biogenesis protein CcmH
MKPRMNTNKHEYKGVYGRLIGAVSPLIRVYSCLFVVALMAQLVMAQSARATPQDEARGELRAKQLFTEVRCVQCQSESIADSDAQIAGDMRREIRADISAGKTDAQIRKELYAHYGDYVLFRPRFSLSNGLLWLTPPLIALLGGFWLWLSQRKPVETMDYALSDAEEKKLREIMKKHD